MRTPRHALLCLTLALGPLLSVDNTACNARNVVEDLPITSYVPAPCGDAGGAQVSYTGLGDFSPVTPAVETALLASTGFALTALPPASREIVVSPVGDGGLWTGTALVPTSGPIPILTLPLNRACHLSLATGLGDVPGVALGMIDGAHALLVGGSIPPRLIDLGQGVVTPFSDDLMPARNYATVTPFGSGAVIAGGEDPMAGEQSTAVIYTPGKGGGLGSFGTTIDLPDGQTREKHAAVLLPDGRVLLIGGVNSSGEPISTVDVLDPAHPSAPLQVSAGLIPRESPTALLLPNGQVFIGGGFGLDGTPVATVEWLDPSLAKLATQTLCAPEGQQVFAPTEGGAVLAVAAAWAGNSACSNVQLVLPSGIEEAPVLSPAPRRVTLFQGAQASPVVVTDNGALRWDPWTGVFSPLSPTPPQFSLPTNAFVAASTGLAMWLGEDANVWTLRFDTHGEYATDVAHGPYLALDDTFMAPDRLPGADVRYSVANGASLSNGGTVWLTDATFATVTASALLREGGPLNVVLREASGTEVVCSVPNEPPETTVVVTRNGASVSVSAGNGPAGTCNGSPAADDRVAIGLRGPGSGQGTSTVRSLAVVR